MRAPTSAPVASISSTGFRSPGNHRDSTARDASASSISQRAAEETLKEAKRVTQRGITINTFMLDDSPVLKGFVDEMTRLNKGRAFYTRPDRLGQYLLVDYLLGQRRKV